MYPPTCTRQDKPGVVSTVWSRRVLWIVILKRCRVNECLSHNGFNPCVFVWFSVSETLSSLNRRWAQYWFEIISLVTRWYISLKRFIRWLYKLSRPIFWSGEHRVSNAFILRRVESYLVLYVGNRAIVTNFGKAVDIFSRQRPQSQDFPSRRVTFCCRGWLQRRANPHFAVFYFVEWATDFCVSL